MGHVIIVGAGPAGASLSYLLAHRGIDVTLLERRRNFAREFRGEILMPSGIEALQQMGLAAALTAVPAHRQQSVDIYMNGRALFSATLPAESFEGRPPTAVSQPALLEELVSQASRSPRFNFMRGVSVRELKIEADDRVTGVRLRGDQGERTLAADLVVGADGRQSMVRRHMRLNASEMSPPMDIVWCKLPCPTGWQGLRAYAGRGHLLVAYHTWDGTLQLGWVILKGTFGALKHRGIEQWIDEMANHVASDLAAHLRQHVDAADKPFLLSAVADCVECWSMPGALVIGDAAHTMSPVAGQGVNIALRDAIVAANHLAPVLARPAVDAAAVDAALRNIEDERMPEIRRIQTLQAQPPKVLLNRAWWGEPIRWLAGTALRSPAVRLRAATRISDFLYGAATVKLKV